MKPFWELSGLEADQHMTLTYVESNQRKFVQDAFAWASKRSEKTLMFGSCCNFDMENGILPRNNRDKCWVDLYNNVTEVKADGHRVTGKKTTSLLVFCDLVMARLNKLTREADALGQRDPVVAQMDDYGAGGIIFQATAPGRSMEDIRRMRKENKLTWEVESFATNVSAEGAWFCQTQTSGDRTGLGYLEYGAPPRAAYGQRICTRSARLHISTQVHGANRTFDLSPEADFSQ